MGYPYPKECFHKNILVTQQAKRDFEQKYDRWHELREKIIDTEYPYYWKETDWREKERVRKIVGDKLEQELGYRI